jgi:cell wall-associated NlpC family hydrolase
MALVITDPAPAPGFVPEYVDLLGSRFAYGGRGPDVFDCYGLVMELHKRCGQTIPDVLSPDEQSRIATVVDKECQIWTPCQIGPGAVVTFRIGRYVSHVGLMLSKSKFIHIWEGSNLGVAVENISAWERRIAGVYRFNAK